MVLRRLKTFTHSHFTVKGQLGVDWSKRGKSLNKHRAQHPRRSPFLGKGLVFFCIELIITMDDIEDLGPSLDGMDLDETSSRNRESVTIRRMNKRQIAEKKLSANDEGTNSSLNEMKGSIPEAALPGVGTVWIKTWGCSHNVSDSEYMAGQLAVHGYEVTEDEVTISPKLSLFLSLS